MLHAHPKPSQDRIIQYAALLLSIVCMLAALTLAIGTASGLPGFLLVMGALILLLIPFLLLQTVATPAVILTAEGLEIQPRLWKHQTIRWDDVRGVKPYPLLPPSDTETGRRAMVGRKRYRAAEGIMLIIPALPMQYRITGFFAGEGFTPVIALTNRTHSEYEQLIRQLPLTKEMQP